MSERQTKVSGDRVEFIWSGDGDQKVVRIYFPQETILMYSEDFRHFLYLPLALTFGEIENLLEEAWGLWRDAQHPGSKIDRSIV